MTDKIKQKVIEILTNVVNTYEKGIGENSISISDGVDQILKELKQEYKEEVRKIVEDADIHSHSDLLLGGADMAKEVILKALEEL